MISEISISIYDLKGALVDRLFKGKMGSGYHNFVEAEKYFFWYLHC